MTPELLTAERTAALLPYDALADEIAAVVLEHAAGAVTVPERSVVDLGVGTLLCMPATDGRLAIVKVVTVHPGNAGTNLPTIGGEVIVADAGDGRRLGVLHGGTVTARRTAALSLLAVRTLRRHGWGASSWGTSGGGDLLIIGAGAQGQGHAEALAAEPGVANVVIASRTRAQAESLADLLAARGHRASSVPMSGAEFEAVVAGAAIVVTATTSREPVLSGGLAADAVVCAVGAYRHDMAELAVGLVSAAGVVVVDTLTGAKAEAGELIAAVDAGAWSWERAVPLVALLGPSRPPVVTNRPGHAVFKSVGHALYDLAAARVAFGS